MIQPDSDWQGGLACSPYSRSARDAPGPERMMRMLWALFALQLRVFNHGDGRCKVVTLALASVIRRATDPTSSMLAASTARTGKSGGPSLNGKALPANGVPTVPPGASTAGSRLHTSVGATAGGCGRQQGIAVNGAVHQQAEL